MKYLKMGVRFTFMYLQSLTQSIGLMDSLKASLELKHFLLILVVWIQLVLDHNGVSLMDALQEGYPEVTILTQQPAEILQLVRLGHGSEDLASKVLTSWTSTLLVAKSVIEFCHDFWIQFLHGMESVISRTFTDIP